MRLNDDQVETLKTAMKSRTAKVIAAECGLHRDSLYHAMKNDVGEKVIEGLAKVIPDLIFIPDLIPAV